MKNHGVSNYLLFLFLQLMQWRNCLVYSICCYCGCCCCKNIQESSPKT